MQDKINGTDINKISLSEGDNLVSKISELFIEDLNGKIINCFDSIDQSLFKLAEKSDSNVKQTRFLDSMRLIQEHRIEIIETFLFQIKSIFEDYRNGNLNYFSTDHSSNNEEERLELIDEGDLDETLAKTNLINKSEAAYHKHIFAFKKRFSYLAKKRKISSEQLPVSPYIIVNAFKKSINIAKIEIDIKVIMYKFFERSIMGLLNDIYTQINDLFIEQGVVPKIKYDIYSKNKHSSKTKSKTKGTKNNNVSQSTDNNAFQADHQQNNKFSQESEHNYSTQRNLDQNYQVITQILNLGRQFSNNSKSNNTSDTAGNNVHRTVIDVKLVINALSVLQNYLLENSQLSEKLQYPPIQVKDRLLEKLNEIDSKTKEQKVKQIDEDTIDLVGLLFQFIVDDRNLPEPIQIILAKLQLPYLKVALQDRNLFADKNHEARMLLDKLALASVGWSKESDLNNQFINKIEEIARHIIETDTYNSRIFEMLYINFDSFLINSKKKSDSTLKRTNERAAGEEKIIIAKENIAQILVKKVSNVKLPCLMKDIIINEWSNVLILLHLRFSLDSIEFKEAVDFIDNMKLFSKINLDVDVDETAIKKILRIYEKGLKYIIFQQDELLKRKNLLKACLFKIHQISSQQSNKKIDKKLLYPNNLLSLSDVQDKNNDISKRIEKIINPQENENEGIIEDTYFQMVSSLKRGTWVEFLSNGKDPIRAKLAWISPVSDKYLFVNSRGYKMIEKSSFELAEEFQNQSCQILLQIALFDRALSSIAENLKKDNNLHPQ